MPFQTTNRELYGVEGALSYTYGIMEYDIFRFVTVISGGTRYVRRRGNVPRREGYAIFYNGKNVVKNK